MKRTMSSLTIGVLILLFAVGNSQLASSMESIQLDLANPEHVAMITSPLPNWPISVAKDPFGELALFYPQGSSAMAPPANTYQSFRFALFNTPDVHDFAISLESIGVGGRDAQGRPDRDGGNRSLGVVFGYQDIQNWWIMYLTYTNATRVSRMIDGKQHDICRPGVTEAWIPNNLVYQEGKVVLTTEGENMVLRSYVNGQPTPVDMCIFPVGDYTGGKVGIGGHSTSTVQSWFFRNIKLDLIN